MRRRDLLGIAVGAVGLPVAGRAQSARVPVIGYLSARSPGDSPALLAAFYRGLGEGGYAAGQNLAVEFRWADGHYDRFPALAADLVGVKVDVIVAAGGVTSARAAKAATSAIPIVFFSGGDPVRDGLVASLARPGGNLTGVNLQLGELTPNRIELLTDLAPQAKLIGFLVNPNNANAERLIPDAEAAARAKGVQLAVLQASAPGEIDAAFGQLAGLRADALVVGDDPFFSQRREQVVALTAHSGLLAIYPQREFAAVGGLISYSASFIAAQRLLGIYCGRILKGARPADLPVEQPTVFELVINLKTARALGLTVPQSLLARADEVIE